MSIDKLSALYARGTQGHIEHGGHDSDSLSMVTNSGKHFPFARFVESEDARLHAALHNLWPHIEAVVRAVDESTDECHRLCASWNLGDDCNCGYVARCDAREALDAAIKEQIS